LGFGIALIVMRTNIEHEPLFGKKMSVLVTLVFGLGSVRIAQREIFKQASWAGLECAT
jgi:hypothetical protein